MQKKRRQRDSRTSQAEPSSTKSRTSVASSLNPSQDVHFKNVRLKRVKNVYTICTLLSHIQSLLILFIQVNFIYSPFLNLPSRFMHTLLTTPTKNQNLLQFNNECNFAFSVLTKLSFNCWLVSSVNRSFNLFSAYRS